MTGMGGGTGRGDDFRPDCPFCNLNDRPIFENQWARVILSNPRKVPGHALVIPRLHAERPWELTRDELADIFSLIMYIQQRMIPELGLGCDVRQHYRPFIQQSRLKVDHVHYHVVPRSSQDAIFQQVEHGEAKLFQDLGNEERNRVETILRRW